jgi:hypothetical protein
MLTLQGTSSIVITLTLDRSFASSSVVVLDNTKANLYDSRREHIISPPKQRVTAAENKEKRQTWQALIVHFHHIVC